MLARCPLAIAIAAACATTPKHPIPVAVLVDGDPGAVGTLPVHAVAGLELRAIELPASPAAPGDDSAATVAAARAAYAKGDFDACRDALAHVDVVARLAAGDRPLVSRLTNIGTRMLRSPIQASRYGDRGSCGGEPLLDRAGGPECRFSSVSDAGSFGWPSSDFGAS